MRPLTILPRRSPWPNSSLTGKISFIFYLLAWKITCPKDISLVTIDDFPLASVFNPRLTSVRQPVRGMAQLSLQLLLRRIAAKEPIAEAEHHVVEPTFVVRGSCSPHVPRARIEAGAGSGAANAPAVVIGE